MATMYPGTMDRGAPRSERDVYECLRDGLPEDWSVIHGKRFNLRPDRVGSRAIEGELDFLVIHPKRGALALEVKGGQEIGQDDQGWYSIPYGQTQKKRIKNPGRQVQDGVHKLLPYIRRRTTNTELSEISYCWGVAFPGMEVGERKEMGPELPRAIVLDKSGLRDPRRTLEGMYTHWLETEGREQTLSGPASDELIRLMMPPFRLMRALGPAPEPILSRLLGRSRPNGHSRHGSDRHSKESGTSWHRTL